METSTQWSPEDIRNNAKTWSLEGDSQLLELMKNISKNLLQKSNDTVDNVNKMTISLEKSCIDFENASNKLSALSKRQFVENRVYEDENEIKPEKKFVVQEQIKAYNPNETIKVILKNNIKMLEKCYDKISVNLDDSDEEDEYVKSTIIYRPKNLYGKQLPMLIGSNDWNEKWHIGLFDSDDESISEKGSAIEEYSDDSSANISLPSIGPTISESGSSIWSINRNQVINNSKKLVNLVQSSDEEGISSHTFASKTSSEEISRKKNTSEQSAHSDFLKYYIHKPKEKKPRVDSTDSEEDMIIDKVQSQNIPKQRISIVSQKKKREKTDIKVSNILSEEPPNLDDDENVKKLDKNLNEFFDSDVVDVLTRKRSISHNTENKTVEKNLSLFDENDFEYFIKDLNTKTLETRHTNTVKKVNLFKSDSESELDKQSKSNLNYVNASKNSIGNYHKEKVETNERGTKTYKTIDLISSIKKPNNLFDDVDNEADDLFSPTKLENKTPSEYTNSSVLLKTKISNLFDDEPPEDEFDYLFQTSKNKTSSATHEIDDVTSESSESKNDSQSNFKTEISNENKVILSNTEFLFKDKKIKSISTKEDIPSNSQTLGGKRKNLLSNLFSHDWTDDEEDLFCTKQAQNTKENLENQSKNDEEYDDTESKTVNLDISITSSKVPPIDFDVSLKEKLKEEKESIITNLNVNDNIKKIINVATTEHNYQNSNNDNKSTEVLEKVSKFSAEISVEKKEKYPVENVILPIKVIENKNEEVQVEKQNKEGSEIKYNNNEEEQGEIVLEEKLKEIKQSDFKSTIEFIEKTSDLHGEIDNKTDTTYNQKDLYSLLFSDTPPEDEDIFAKSTLSTITPETLPNTFEKNLLQTNLLLYNNNNIALFDDVPPDDLLEETKKLSDMFHEDFESTPGTIFETEIQPNYIISDEPPPDDYFNNNLFEESSKKENKELYLSYNNPTSNIFLKDNQDFIYKNENTNHHFETSKTVNKSADKNKENQTILNKSESDIFSPNDQLPKQATHNGIQESTGSPLKLKENFIPNAVIPHEIKVSIVKKSIDEIDSVLEKANLLNINVAALLPGAKRPLKGKENHMNNNINRNNNSLSAINNSVYSENFNNIPEEGKLIGLNKNRAKILVKRKPSTRQARQESYRKSLVGNNDVFDTNGEFVSNVQKESSKNSINKESNDTLYEVSTSVKNNEEIKRSDISENDTYQILSSNDELFQNKNLRNEENSQHKTFLFGEIEDSDNCDWLSQLSSTNKESLSQKENLINKNSFNNNSDDIFNYSEIFNSKTSIKKLNFESKQIIDHDDIFKTNLDSHRSKSESINKNFKQVPELNFANKNENSKNINQSISNSLQQTDNFKANLIENYDNDDDDLFSSSFVKKVIPAQIPNNLMKTKTVTQKSEKNSYDEADNEIFKKVKIKKPFLEKFRSSQQSIISDVEIDSTKEYEDKSKNLFSSDDDDSLFGGSTIGNRSKKSIQNKKTENKVKEVSSEKQEKMRENLFNDIGNDDSDDDLFGLNKTSKVAITSKVVNKSQLNRGAIPKRLLEKKVIKTEDNYNPLADLLNQ